MNVAISIHPSVDKGIRPGKDDFKGGTLRCRCANDPVTVKVDSQSAHNHACGCTKCWKPAGAVFSVVAVVPRDKVAVTANGHKCVSIASGHLCLACMIMVLAASCKSLIFFSARPFW